MPINRLFGFGALHGSCESGELLICHCVQPLTIIAVSSLL